MTGLLSLAVRNVRRNRRRSAITLGAIILGVTSAVVLRGFSEGFLNLVVDDVVNGRVGALQVHRAGYLDSAESVPLDLDLPHSPELLDKLRAIEGVKAVTPRLAFTGLVSNGVAQTTFIGRGLQLGTEREVCPRFGFDVRTGGQPLVPGDTGAALVGYELAESFGLKPPDGLITLASSSPHGRANSLTVTTKGLTQSGAPFENKRVVTVPLALAQDLLGMHGRVTEYALAVDDLDQTEAVAGRVRAALGPGFEVHTWNELQPFVRDLLVRQRFIFALVTFILFVIVLTGIVNTMLMSVFERVREIGTMMAVGVKRRQVLTLFLLESATLGLFGGLLGGVVGRLAVHALHVQGIPMKVIGSSTASLLRPTLPFEQVILAALLAALGALLAALYPAWKASRLSPVEALRSL